MIPDVLAGAKPGAATGTATLRGDADDRITGDTLGGYSGTFDKSGNFSFSSSSGRFICFDFGAELPLLDPPRIAGTPLMGERCVQASFTTLSGASGSGLLTIAPGTFQVRSVRFNFPNTESASPLDYSLEFRGDAILDGRTEMARMLVTCTAAHTSGGCGQWVLEPCTTTDAVPGGVVCPADSVAQNLDGTEVEEGVGQLYGRYPRGQGNSTIARYIMRWQLTVTRN
jgi:hypothetical protein